MRIASIQRALMLCAFALLIALSAGCGRGWSLPPGKPAEDASTWWCAEHGVPEAECSRCSERVAAECKKRGDWCEKHDRADSQCFLCHPELEAKFAARYEAVFGEKPPKPTE